MFDLIVYTRTFDVIMFSVKTINKFSPHIVVKSKKNSDNKMVHSSFTEIYYYKGMNFCTVRPIKSEASL